MRKVTAGNSRSSRFEFITTETFPPTKVDKIKIAKRGLIFVVHVGGKALAHWFGFDSMDEDDDAARELLYPTTWSVTYVCADGGGSYLMIADDEVEPDNVWVDSKGWFHTKVD